jgi:hypothetical protein
MELTNRQFLEYFGKTREEIKDWVSNDAILSSPQNDGSTDGCMADSVPFETKAAKLAVGTYF